MHQVWTRVLGSGIVNPHLAIGRGLGVSLQSSCKLKAVIRRSNFFRGRFNAASPQGLPQDPISKRKKATSLASGVLFPPKSLNHQNYADLDQRLQVLLSEQSVTLQIDHLIRHGFHFPKDLLLAELGPSH